MQYRRHFNQACTGLHRSDLYKKPAGNHGPTQVTCDQTSCHILLPAGRLSPAAPVNATGRSVAAAASRWPPLINTYDNFIINMVKPYSRRVLTLSKVHGNERNTTTLFVVVRFPPVTNANVFGSMQNPEHIASRISTNVIVSPFICHDTTHAR